MKKVTKRPSPEDSMAAMLAEQGELLTPAEVAKLFKVDPKTVTRWARAGKLPAVRTLGGHRRYRLSVVKELLAKGTTPQG